MLFGCIVFVHCGAIFHTFSVMIQSCENATVLKRNTCLGVALGRSFHNMFASLLKLFCMFLSRRQFRLILEELGPQRGSLFGSMFAVSIDFAKNKNAEVEAQNG